LQDTHSGWLCSQRLQEGLILGSERGRCRHLVGCSVLGVGLLCETQSCNGLHCSSAAP
jgi:hypothetical protein